MLTRFGILIICLVALVACGGAADDADVDSLLVTDGTEEQLYSVSDLEQLSSAQAVFGGITYIGVPLATLIMDAGYNPNTIAAIKAVAQDGFTANYDPELVNRSDTLVAYKRDQGALSDDDGTFRMVLPDQEGKLNPRHLVELKIIQ